MAAPARKPASPSEAKLLEFAELLFFAYRDFTRDPDAILADFDFGRAHHRVLHFVNRHSGLRVADLLDVLNITKQSLRPRAEAIDRQGLCRAARRQLGPPRAAALPDRQGPRARRAARGAAIGAPRRCLAGGRPWRRGAVRRFLEAMVNAEERPKVSSIMASSPVPLKEGGKGGA